MRCSESLSWFKDYSFIFSESIKFYLYMLWGPTLYSIIWQVYTVIISEVLWKVLFILYSFRAIVRLSLYVLALTQHIFLYLNILFFSYYLVPKIQFKSMSNEVNGKGSTLQVVW